MVFSLPNIVIKPDRLTLLYRDRPLCTPFPKTQKHQSTCVDSGVHGVHENGHQPLGRGNSLWHSACPILWSNPIFKRDFTEIAPLCPLALRLRNTKVPVWTHESIGYPKMDISHWDAAIHYGIQLAQYCHQTRSFNAISPRSPPLCSLAQDSGTPNYLCWLMSPYGTRKWTSAIGTRQFTMAFSLPNIVIKPDLLTRFHRDRPLCAPLP